MTDIIAALLLSALFVAMVGTLADYALDSRRDRVVALSGAGAWAVLIVAAAALGVFIPGAMGPVPAIPLVFAALLLAGLTAWARSTDFRTALLGIPTPVLIGLNGGRMLGVFFLILYASGRITAPFAPSAGWGDVITGVVALPLAAMAATGRAPRQWLRLWNTFGALDLIVAVSLGVLSAPGGPWQVFTAEPGTAVLGSLPWTLIPALLVPLYLMIHLTIAVQLRTENVRHSRPQTA